MSLFGGCYAGRRVLVTGHTGFKGSWLALWLQQLGAHVIGASLRPEGTPNHWDLLNLDIEAYTHDIRDSGGFSSLVSRTRPDAIFHLAAQSLVRRSYRSPMDTWSTNALGTASVLNACRGVDSIAALVVVTTDKCYENLGLSRGYLESDRLGGHDPYSASKAAAEIVTASFRSSFFSEDSSPVIASARAGNVIGGGDWAEDRIIPDLVRAQSRGLELEVRSPAATRPWQHVLEPLSGYLLLGQHLLEGHREHAKAWNFGPDSDGNCSVAGLIELMREAWPSLKWRKSERSHPHEAALLQLDSSQARRELSWRPVWTLKQCARETARWYDQFLRDGSLLSHTQLDRYIDDARSMGLAWAQP